MAKRLSFHIQQNLTLSRLLSILTHIDTSDSQKVLAKLSAECFLSVDTMNKVVLPFARQLGLLNTKGLSLTKEGEQFYQLARQSSALYSEALHHLLYTKHHFDGSRRFSWAYARVVEALWVSGQRTLDRTTLSQIVGTVVDEASRKYDVPIEQIAFSDNSVRGVLNWLRALEPSVVYNDGKNFIFRRRYFCREVSLLWVVDFLYRVAPTPYGVRMFLTPERIDELCKLCVLDPSGLNNVLMLAKRMSDYDRGGIFDYGTEGGFGRWLLLAQPCPVPTLPPGGHA